MLQNSPLISVVIPAYNEEKYIRDSLESLKKQTFTNFEIIVTNNNSSDKTAEIARKFGAEVVLEKEQGYVFALNTGLKSARGEIIAVTDADTIVPSHWLASITRAFEDPQVAAVTGPLKHKTKSVVIDEVAFFLYCLFLRINFLVGKPHMSGPSMAIRKSVFEKIGGLNIKYQISADVELGLQARKYGKVLLIQDLTVLASPRRWKNGIINEFLRYTQAYFAAVWFGIPPHGRQKPVR